MNKKLLPMFKDFISDPDGWEMFVTGQAGTGKTTQLSELVEYCIEQNIDYVVCAYTHKACDILRSKLPKGANVRTLHSFLTKRPTINEHAKKIQHLEASAQHGKPEEYKVCFLDEYSMLGEKDYVDIGMLQDPEGEGDPVLRVVHLGDSNQLPPVGDQAAIYPSGKYKIELTHVYRQAGDNPLLDTLGTIVNLINGKEFNGLPEHRTFSRGHDLGKLFNELKEDRVCLAFTNKRVEELNQAIAGKDFPSRNDDIFSPTTKQHYTYLNLLYADNIVEISRSFNDEPLGFGSKYKTLEHLIDMNCCSFMEVMGPELDDLQTFAVVFGHYEYKMQMEKYANAAVEANAEVEEAANANAKEWCAVNKKHPLARKRARAWRDYFTFKECVVCMDFPYAMTVHKSQGSTYDTVLVDTEDLYQCASRDYNLYLKLMYVAISRASNKVYTT